MSGAVYHSTPGYLAPGRAGVLQRNWWLVLTAVPVALLFGLIAIAQPGITLASLVLLFGIYMAVDGVFAIAAGGARGGSTHECWGWSGFSRASSASSPQPSPSYSRSPPSWAS